MRDAVIASYDAYREEDRLTTNNARRIEFLTTARALEALLPPACDLLDCAAGMGVYAGHFAAIGHRVTATDLTPRHIDLPRAIAAGHQQPRHGDRPQEGMTLAKGGTHHGDEGENAHPAGG